MRGTPNLLGKLHSDPATSTYMTTFRGLMTRSQTKPFMLDLAQSCSTGTIVPDPVLYKTLK